MMWIGLVLVWAVSAFASVKIWLNKFSEISLGTLLFAIFGGPITLFAWVMAAGDSIIVLRKRK